MSTIKSSAENLTLNADGANNDVIIQSNGSTKVTVDGQNSRVGIGTATPASELHISDSGGCILTMTGESVNSSFTAHSGGWNYDVASGKYHTFVVNGTDEVKISSDGILFGSDTAAANALDDYEEGTWTPAWDSPGTAPTVSHTPVGKYVKIGQLVFCTINMGASGSVSGGSGDNLTISGLPFTAAADSGHGTLTVPRCQNWNSDAVTPITGYINAGEAYIILQKYSAAYAAHTTVKTQDLRTSGDSNQFKSSIFYRTTA